MKVNTFVVCLFWSFFAFSQTGAINGTVLDEGNGKPLPGVTVVLTTGNRTAMSDLDGHFYFDTVAVGSHDIACSFVSFAPKTVTGVEVKKGEVTDLTIVMSGSSEELQEVVVVSTAKARTESLKSLLTLQKNSPYVSDGISAETIKRTPDRNVSDALRRISGASVQQNRFIVIRGLNDRYNANMINGTPLPSTEPDRKAFSFDIFPSNIVDNLIIAKTATPDQPGEFAGGIIQINTKGIPDRNFQSLSIGSGYNTQTTGKEQLDYKGGSTDWLGIDDGTRALPSQIPDYFNFRDLTASERAGYAQYLDSDWSLRKKTFAPNISFQYTNARRFSLFGKQAGFLLSASYNKTNNFFETIRRDYENPGPEEPSLLYADFLDSNYVEQYLVGGLLNFTLKLNANNSLSFKNIYSINSDDRVIIRSGTPFQATDVNPLQLYSSVRWFTGNRIYSGQLIGEHFFTAAKQRLTWLVSYSNVQRDIPNLRRNIYTFYKEVTDPSNPNPADLQPVASIAEGNAGADYGGGMFFSKNSENGLNVKADFSQPIGKEGEIKTGLFFHRRDRDFYARQLQYNKLNTGTAVFDDSLLTLPDATIFNPGNIGITGPGTAGFTLFDGSKYFDSYTASADLTAFYMMADNRWKKFRFIYGVRMESYRQQLTTRLTDTEWLRQKENQVDVLPSANVVYALTEQQNLRLSYSQTINRPEFRELAPFGFYDFTTQFFTSGNPALSIANIQNFDFRYEIFPGRNQLFSVSAFYKKFRRPIELIAGINNKEVSYKNAESARNFGFELEFRTVVGSWFGREEGGFLNDLTVFSNLSIIDSKVDVSNLASASDDQKERPMQGQSPYVFNAGLQYANESSGWIVSVNVNRVGNRIAVVGNTEAEPDLWEKSRTLLDAQLAKRFLGNKLEIKCNIQNLLDQDLIFYQNKTGGKNVTGISALANGIFTGDKQNADGYQEGVDDLVWSSRFGSTFSLSVLYNF
ncbi:MULTISPECIES: TonB-dependent receptor [unclassified Flavobacterium]|uniref:TonB-dependent receptor n=1 Tax=unclassified Flavobacterium TaxID=196869 RepID=UPI001F136600|nr:MULTISPECIES: TonB-dependent receptor [unclassified Flavobacterium]UMY66420.1 TonB-dependent receptor [Flavobacterium sp. HJ-32-4]